ncbi:hypothetical protein [Enterococcus rotai]
MTKKINKEKEETAVSDICNNEHESEHCYNTSYSNRWCRKKYCDKIT